MRALALVSLVAGVCLAAAGAIDHDVAGDWTKLYAGAALALASVVTLATVRRRR